MKRITYVLVASLALNAGVIGAIAYSVLAQGRLPAAMRTDDRIANLPTYLGLTAEQRARWQALEQPFLQELEGQWREIREHRERMIGEIFAPQPDRDRIETERAAIARLQSQQQQKVIEQLRREREILDAGQQRRLAELLSQQAPASTFEERLHAQ